MTARLLAAVLGLGCLGGAFGLAPQAAGQLAEPLRWLVRPAVLPFAWRDLATATRTGDGAEAFAQGQRIMRLLPRWTDGQIVFAYRFATAQGAVQGPVAERGERAWRRLQVALAWLESARATAGKREAELLQAMAMLPEIAIGLEPALDPHLQAAVHGGVPALADRYLAEAERVSDSPAIREQRTFLTPSMAAGLLSIGDRRGAIAVLETGIARSADVRDRALATEWADLLGLVVRHLRGERVDLTAVRADPRMSPLLPHLR